MAECVDAGMYCAVWHNPGHQLPRSLQLHSMKHPLSVNTLMGGKPNNTEGRGQEHIDKLHRDKWIPGASVSQIVNYADDGSCLETICAGQLEWTLPCVGCQHFGSDVKRLHRS